MKRIITILGLISISFSASTMQLSRVNIYDILDDAERNNISIQIYKHKFNIANAQTKQAWSTVFPKFSFDAGANRMQSAVVPLANYYSASIGLSQILFNGSVFPAITASDYGLQAAKADLAATKETVYYNVVNLYFSIIQFEEQLDVIKDSKDQLQRILNQTYELNKNGLATEIDVLRTKASLSGVNATVISMANAKETMKNNLEMLLNKELTGERFDSSIITKLYESGIIDNGIGIEDVLKKRQDYQQLKNITALMKTNIDIQSGGYLPSLVLVANYGYQGTNGFNFNDNNKDWLLGVNGNWNVFDFGTNQAKIDEAMENYKIMDRQVAQLKLAIEKELVGINLNIKSAKAKIEAVKLEEKSNNDVFNMVNSRYHLGEVTHLELMDAQNSLSRARGKFVEAKIEYAMNVLQWLKATGKILNYFEKE